MAGQNSFASLSFLDGVRFGGSGGGGAESGAPVRALLDDAAAASGFGVGR